jgi:hypothetical protein
MNRKFVIFAAALAAFAFTAQGADAKWRKHHKDHKTLTAVSIGVGVASTGAYFAIKHHDGWNDGAGLSSGAAWTLSTVGCAAVSPIVATAVLNRPLSYREAHALIASCILPVVGGWLVNQAYDNGTWVAPDEPVHKMHHKKKKT